MAVISEEKNMVSYQEEIQEKINSSHNPDLVIKDASPNGNRIYHIYSDGEITNQKGGWAYLRRSEFSDKPPIVRYSHTLKFPIKLREHSYAVVVEKDAHLIRDMMIRDSIRHLI
jgi:hypothetical protein